jgi:hypothetical protein
LEVIQFKSTGFGTKNNVAISWSKGSTQTIACLDCTDAVERARVPQLDHVYNME